MNIKKEASVLSAGLPDPSQLEQINRFAKTPLEAEEVYVFSVRSATISPTGTMSGLTPRLCPGWRSCL